MTQWFLILVYKIKIRKVNKQAEKDKKFNIYIQTQLITYSFNLSNIKTSTSFSKSDLKKKSTLVKESLNNDGQQFHQYQQSSLAFTHS